MSEIKLRCYSCGYVTPTSSHDPKAALYQHRCRPKGTAPPKRRPASAKKGGLADFAIMGCVLSVMAILFVSVVGTIIALAFFPLF